jgi:pimeloyl-ACP methyl ester carboxylesterase
MANTCILIHGSWLGKFCWDEVIALLEKLGHTTISIDLPAHGEDPTLPEQTSLDGYRDAVIAAIGDLTDIILVGHSMAGVVISAVAEAIPDRLKSLVYRRVSVRQRFQLPSSHCPFFSMTDRLVAYLANLEN